ncbi:MAG: trypsin-like peptidase domain-containing protein, partial [Pseudomonadales bacterium]
ALEQATTVSVRYMGQDHAARILSIDKQTDLALLDTNTGQLHAIGLSEKNLQSQEPVWSVAFPMAMAQRTELGLYQKTFNERLLTSTHANQGSSGGGLLRCNQGDFELAGIIHGYIAVRVGNDRFNSGDSTSVPASIIRHFLNASVDTDRQLLSKR